MSDNPLVSVIVPTYNSSQTLAACLGSIKEQSYKNIEIIVVDNNSTDETKKIAYDFTTRVYNKGNERSAQVNYGVEKAKSDYVYKVDSDFILDSSVVKECIDEIKRGFDAVVVHNSPDVRVSWIARIRKFEVDMYKYDITHSSARFVSRDAYKNVGGFNVKITAGEDYDFQNKLNRQGFKTGFIDAEALHLGEPKRIIPHLKKYYDYGKDFVNYTSLNKSESNRQIGVFRVIYFKKWKHFIANPLIAICFLFYTMLKYAAGGFGYISAKYFFNTNGDSSN